MTLAADIADDYLLFDDPASVVLATANGSVTVTKATSGALNRKELQRLDGIAAGDVKSRRFRLPVAQLSGSVPRNGDTITHDGDIYLIQTVDLVTLDTAYLALCTRA